MTVWDWHTSGGAARCAACRQGQSRTGKTKDCRRCERCCSELAAGNRLIWHFWQTVYSLWRFGPGGPVGLDYAAIFQVAPLYGVKITRLAFIKLKALEAKELARVYQQEKGKD